MSADVYEILSLAARYLFALLGALAVLRAFFWLARERSVRHARLRQNPDIGMVGEMLVMNGSDELPAGMVIPVPKEGVLGCVRGCDIVVPCPGVNRYHLDFSFEYAGGLSLSPRGGNTAMINGVPLDGRSGKSAMNHGSVLEVGSAVLKLRLFAALNYGDGAAAFSPEAAQQYGTEIPGYAQGFPPTAMQQNDNGIPMYAPPYSDMPAPDSNMNSEYRAAHQASSDMHRPRGNRGGWEDDWSE